MLLSWICSKTRQLSIHTIYKHNPKFFYVKVSHPCQLIKDHVLWEDLKCFLKNILEVKESVWKGEVRFYSQLQQHLSSILWFEQKPQNTKASAEQLSVLLGTHRGPSQVWGCSSSCALLEQLLGKTATLIQLLLTGNMQNHISETMYHSSTYSVTSVTAWRVLVSYLICLEEHTHSTVWGLLRHAAIVFFLSLKVWRPILPQLAQWLGPCFCLLSLFFRS